MGMMIKQNKSVIENSKRENVIKAAQELKQYCASAPRNCEGCPFFSARNCVLQGGYPPDEWELPTLAPSREEMHKYVKDHCFLRTFKNGRTTATVYNGKLYLVTRYYKDKDDELVATYELYKKIFG